MIERFLKKKIKNLEIQKIHLEKDSQGRSTRRAFLTSDNKRSIEELLRLEEKVKYIN